MSQWPQEPYFPSALSPGPSRSFLCAKGARGLVKNTPGGCYQAHSQGGVCPGSFLILVAKPEELRAPSGRAGQGEGVFKQQQTGTLERACLLCLSHERKCSPYHMLKHDTLIKTLQTTVPCLPGAPAAQEAPLEKELMGFLI